VNYLMILPAFHIAIIFLVAMIVKIKKYEYEHAITRLMVAGLYFYIEFNHSLDENARQLLVRWFLLLVGSVEIISYFTRLMVIRGRS